MHHMSLIALPMGHLAGRGRFPALLFAVVGLLVMAGPAGAQERESATLEDHRDKITSLAVSPDGKTLAYVVQLIDDQTKQTTQKVALLNLDGSSAPKLLDVNPQLSGNVRFTLDGKSIAYAVRDNGVDNLLVQPLDGSPRRQITNFKCEQISTFDGSPDGKSIVLRRFHNESDVVLLQESKP